MNVKRKCERVFVSLSLINVTGNNHQIKHESKRAEIQKARQGNVAATTNKGISAFLCTVKMQRNVPHFSKVRLSNNFFSCSLRVIFDFRTV